MSQLALLGGVPVCDPPYAGESWPPITEKTADRLGAVYSSGAWSFDAPAERAFCAAFAAYQGAEHGIFMANGTVTLEGALAALGIGPGDEVVVPALTWPATAMAVHYVGALPVFADVEPTTLCLDPAAFEAAVTPRTRAVIPVHLYGSMADLDAIRAVAGKHKIAVVEDCAHMPGGRWAGRGVGTWGAVGSFSFQQSKPLSAGEGGLCITNDDCLAERLFRFKHIGYRPGEHQGNVSEGPPPDLLCRNYRATAFQAAILLDQLETLDERLARYEATAARITEQLSAAGGPRLQARGRRATRQGYYALAVFFDEPPASEIPLSTLLAALAAEGVQARPTYGPVYHHVLYTFSAGRYRIEGGCCPVAETLGAQRTVCLIHRLLGDPGKADVIARALIKTAKNAGELTGWTPPQ